MPMQKDMGVWRAFLRFFNALPRPSAIKRWSHVKIASVTVLVLLTVLALVRLEKELHQASSVKHSRFDHRTLLTKRFETFEEGGVKAVEEANGTVGAAISLTEEEEEEEDEAGPTDSGQGALMVDSIPPPVTQPTGQRIFETPKRSPLNERPLPDDVMGEYFPLQYYFHKSLSDKTPKTPPQEDASKLDTKIPLKKVLVVLEEVKNSLKYNMDSFFGPLRLEIEFAEAQSLPPLVMRGLNVPMFSLIAFTNYEVYLGLGQEERSRLDLYCKTYGVGIFSFTDSKKISEQNLVSDAKLKLQHKMKLTGLKLNSEATDVWKVGKPEMVFNFPLPNTNSEWTIFLTDHPTYQPLAFSTVAADWSGSGEGINKGEFGVVLAVRDKGELDGIRRVILGNDHDFFLNTIIAMDGIGWLSQDRLALPLERIVQIDVDDMFVGVSAVRTRVKDAEAMVQCNRKIRQYVPNFKLFLGFTGAMLFWGDEDADKGEQKILDYAHEFIWFNHLYRHELLYITPLDRISGSMSKNIPFAEEKGLPVIWEYMILPHHAGVYPVYPEVFDEWEKIGYVKATSTLEYPFRHPNWGRRGFTHRGVKVLPRQTCRLFTKTISWTAYEGGKAAMDESINGGFIFKLFLTTPIMVFMTHMSNYATDDLAQHQFEGVTKAIATWTNLKMVAPHPMDTADEYFHLYPDEVTPLWSDPGRDPNMKELWRVNKTLPVFPKFLIAGPQKTGTTALLSFLKIHPNVLPNHPDPILFEEVQFFSSTQYDLGIDWYASRFPERKNERTQLFEKSANYFSHAKAPKRIKALLPDAKIVIIMNNPARRAYSWYQHLKAHNDSITLQHSFYDIITASDKASDVLKAAQKRHLYDGMYAIHLSRWLLSFPTEQLYLIDGDLLIQDPATVMNDLQKFLGLSPKIDYESKLRYDEKKGFFCAKETGCLGQGKGRNYEKMDAASEAYLAKYFKNSNEDLRTLLDSINHPHPTWLKTA